MRPHLQLLMLTALLPLFSSTMFGQACNEEGSILRVKNRSAGNVEYVIFDIKKTQDNKDVEFEVERVMPPFTDYTGDETYSIAGDNFKKITFSSVYWMCQTSERYALPKTAVKGIKMLWSFEGITEFVIGYRSESRYVATYTYDAGLVTKVVMKFVK